MVQYVCIGAQDLAVAKKLRKEKGKYAQCGDRVYLSTRLLDYSTAICSACRCHGAQEAIVAAPFGVIRSALCSTDTVQYIVCSI